VHTNSNSRGGTIPAHNASRSRSSTQCGSAADGKSGEQLLECRWSSTRIEGTSSSPRRRRFPRTNTKGREPMGKRFTGGGPSSCYRDDKGVGDGCLGVGASLLGRVGSPGARLYNRIRKSGHDLASSARERAAIASPAMYGDSVGRKWVKLTARSHHTATHSEHTCQRSD
jgi:hypothetical protein